VAVSAPRLVVLAGPNGAGKTTTAPSILRDALSVREFVNADTIAQGLSAFDVEAAAIRAGRIMLDRIHELARERVDFAFETTLASRSFAPWIRRLASDGHRIELVFVWLASPELAVARVASRVRRGGHSVPETVIRRRYERGLRNFFQLYRPLADRWHFLDNSGPRPLHRIAEGVGMGENRIEDEELWQQLLRQWA
jgi:predicted ABC-type ATPase